MLFLRKLKNYLKYIVLFLGKFFAKVLSKRQSKLVFKNIYIVLGKPLGIGDLIMLVPYIFNIRQIYANKKVFLVTDYPKLFDVKHLNWISPDEITNQDWKESMVVLPDLNFRIPKGVILSRYIIGYIFSTYIFSNFAGSHTGYDLKNDHYCERIKSIISAMGVKEIKPKYNDVKCIDEDLTRLNLPKKYVCMAPLSNWDTRQYDVKRICKILRSLHKHSDVILLGTENERKAFDKYLSVYDSQKVINLMGKTSILELIKIIKGATLTIANDSGPAHISSLFSENSIVIYGCCTPESRMPLNKKLADNVVNFSNGSNCEHFPCFNGLSEPVCKNIKKYTCLDIDPKEITHRAIEILNI
tara:strand:+ start:5726 stop:6796 length:1071 start_codon:yes stop_codon:yes gene_type:complete